MKIDLSQVFRNVVNGEPFKSSYPDLVPQMNEDGTPKLDDNGEPVMGRKNLTLGEVLMDAYLAPSVDPSTNRDLLSGKEKLERTQMARKFIANAGGTIQMKPEHVAVAKELVNKISQMPQVVAQALEMLDETELETEDADDQADA